MANLDRNTSTYPSKWSYTFPDGADKKTLTTAETLPNIKLKKQSE